MEIRKLVLMVLCLVLFGYLCFEGAEGFNNPNQGKYKTIIKKSKEVEESDIEPARAVNPRRKASENKRPWLTDTFLEMENLVFDPWDNVYRTMDWPKYAWPDGTRQNYRPDQYPDWSGCAISAPPYWNIVEKGKTYLVHINIIKGVIRAMQVKGPATLGKIDNLEFPVHVYANAVNGTVVRVTLFTVSVVEQGRYYGQCSAETVIENGECTCSGVVPTVYATGATIAPGGTQTLYVNSGGEACPPYTWTVSGTGYTLNGTTTNNDLETITLTSAGGVCGVNYDAYATVTATDSCGISSTKRVRNTGGQWGAEVVGCAPGLTPSTPGVSCGGGGFQYDCNVTWEIYYQRQIIDRSAGSACGDCCRTYDNSPACTDPGGTWCDNSFGGDLANGIIQCIANQTVCSQSTCISCWYNRSPWFKYQEWTCP